jgi:hypothetical protein
VGGRAIWSIYGEPMMNPTTASVPLAKEGFSFTAQRGQSRFNSCILSSLKAPEYCAGGRPSPLVPSSRICTVTSETPNLREYLLSALRQTGA